MNIRWIVAVLLLFSGSLTGLEGMPTKSLKGSERPVPQANDNIDRGRGVDRGQNRDGRRGNRGRRDFKRNNISRTPSMSRARSWSSSTVDRPNGLEPGRLFYPSKLLPETNASQPQWSNTPRRGIPSQRLSPQRRATINQYYGDRFYNRAYPSNYQRGFNQTSVISNLPNKIRQRSGYGKRLRDQLNREPYRNKWFNNQFWSRHHYRPNYGNGNWWNVSSWSTINGWLPWGWSTPIYYEEGYPINFTPQDQKQYWSSQTQQAPGAGQTWLPLGVFSLAPDSESQLPSSMIFQLVLGRNGTISGTYYNQETDSVYPITGRVDQTSQKAVWRIGQDPDSPVFTTGLYNLSLPETPVSVNFGGGELQDWLMVRL